MDTRNKIISAARAGELLDRNECSVVSGYFDPLLAAHAQRLKTLKRYKPLLIALSEPVNPIVPLAARAELLAGLAVVAYVVLPSPELAARLANAVIHREEEPDTARTAALIQLARARQHATHQDGS